MRSASLLLALTFTFGVTVSSAHAQSIAVFGDAGGEACHRAAKLGDGSRSAREQCDHALDNGTMRVRDRAATYVNRGIVRAAGRDFEGALSDYAAARRTDERTSPHARNGEGNVAFLKGDYQGALRAYREVSALESEVALAARFNLALTLETLGRYDEAERDYLAVIELAPDWGAPQAHLERVRELLERS